MQADLVSEQYDNFKGDWSMLSNLFTRISRSIKPCGLSAVVLMLTCGILKAEKNLEKQTDNYVQNGDFEKDDNGIFPYWNVSGNVKPEQVSGVWRRYTVRFNSGKFRGVNFYFHVNRGSMGSIWIDNVICSSTQIENGGFEEQATDGRPAGWALESESGPAPWNASLFLDTERASDSRKSLRFTHKNDAVPRSRISQQILVEPNREYAISYDLFVGDDFQGDAVGYVYDSTGTSHLTINYDEMFVSSQIETRDRCDRYVAVLSPTTTSASEMTLEVIVKPGMNLQARVDINNKAFTGTAKLVVEDPGSGRILGKTNIENVTNKWQSMQVPFQSISPKLLIRVMAEGSGTLQVDNVEITPPKIVPPLQQVNWLPASENFSLPSLLKIYIKGQAGKVIDGGLALLNNDLKPFGIVAEKTDADNTPFQILIGSQYEAKTNDDEAYSLAVNEKGITIKAGKEAGAFYGLMTLLQLISNCEGKTVVLSCEVTDYPDMPMRGVLYGDPKQAARWKMNTLMVGTGYPVSVEEKKRMADIVQNCERLNLKVIPYFLTIQGGYYVQGKNPNLAAGIWVKDEQITLRGIVPSPLANTYIIRTNLTDVKLKSPDGKQTYVLGKDYQVINGDMGYNYNDSKAKAFTIVRMTDSSIPDGTTILASYDYVSHYRASTKRTEPHIAYCPLEPETHKLMGEFMRDLAKDYPSPYIGPLGCMAEFRETDTQLETDSRVINSGKKPIEMLAEDVCFLQTAAKEGNPNVRMMLWAGNLNEYNKIAAPLLPKDVHIEIWGYDTSFPLRDGRESVEYWSNLGFETSVMAWDNLHNVWGWAQVVAEARRKGYPCLGMLASLWNKRAGGFQETAIVSWKIPKKGEKGFVALPKNEPVKP
jgi:hypothetical protein